MINKDTYKRLTDKKVKGTTERYIRVDKDYILSAYDIVDEEKQDIVEMIINRLAELEDKIMDGTLVELHCKVGDKVFLMAKYNNNIYVGDYFLVEKIGFDKFGFYVETDKGIFRKEQIFLTKDQAEARLKELKGE